MDFRQIQDLVKMINKSNIGELTIEEKDFKITIKQKKEERVSYMAAQQMAPAPMYLPHLAVAAKRLHREW